MSFKSKRKSKKVYIRKTSRRKKNKFSNKKRVTRRVTRKQRVMRGGALTRGQEAKLLALGYTVSTNAEGIITITGAPDRLLINSRLSRDLRTSGRLNEFKAYILNLLNADADIPDNIADLAMKYISGCDLEISPVAQRIIARLNPEDAEDAVEIQEFRDRTKKIGSFLNTRDGSKSLTDIQEVIFQELPIKFEENDDDKLKKNTLYKYVIIEEGENVYKIYYSCASGIPHFSYIDYYVKKHYNQDETLRVNAQRERTPVNFLFFVKNTNIPDKIMLAMSWGDREVKHQWFSLLKDYALQGAEDINDFITNHINDTYVDIDGVTKHKYRKVLSAFGNDLQNIIAFITGMREGVIAYVDYIDDWNTVIMGDEISHSCLTHTLEVNIAGEFCTDENSDIFYVDCWSGHFKPPPDHLHLALNIFHEYGYIDLVFFTNHLATFPNIQKCSDLYADRNCNNQLVRGVTMDRALKIAAIE